MIQTLEDKFPERNLLLMVEERTKQAWVITLLTERQLQVWQ